MPPSSSIIARKSLGDFLRQYIKQRDDEAWRESGRKYLPADLAREMGDGMNDAKIGRLIKASSGMELNTAYLLVNFFGTAVLPHLDTDKDTMQELEFRAMWSMLDENQRRIEFLRMKRIVEGETNIDTDTETAS